MQYTYNVTNLNVEFLKYTVTIDINIRMEIWKLLENTTTRNGNLEKSNPSTVSICSDIF